MSKRDLIKQAILEASDDVIRQVYEILDIEEGPEIPEGFERWNGGCCPVPVDCHVRVIFSDNDKVTNLADDFYWTTRLPQKDAIIAYHVTHVPTLTIDDDYDEYWYITNSGNIERIFNEELLVDYAHILAGMAYRTREHAETALKWGLLHDVYYTKMGFKR